MELVDARSGGPRVGEALAAGLDLDEGMVVLWQGRRFYGVEAVHLIALLSGEGGLGNRVQRWLFRAPRRAALICPWLVRGRRAWLRLVRRAPIGAQKKSVASRE